MRTDASADFYFKHNEKNKQTTKSISMNMDSGQRTNLSMGDKVQENTKCASQDRTIYTLVLIKTYDSGANSYMF